MAKAPNTKPTPSIKAMARPAVFWSSFSYLVSLFFGVEVVVSAAMYQLYLSFLLRMCADRLLCQMSSMFFFNCDYVWKYMYERRMNTYECMYWRELNRRSCPLGLGWVLLA